jgi:hypothetical protein
MKGIERHPKGLRLAITTPVLLASRGNGIGIPVNQCPQVFFLLHRL